MEETREMQFGKKYHIGNFLVFKYTKALNRRELASLRQDIPYDIRKHLQRGGVPFIKVETVSGIWAVEYSCATAVYHLLDKAVGEGGELNETMAAHLFTMWFCDTTVPGDEQYQEEKAKAFKAFTERQKAAQVPDDEDLKTIADMREEQEARATIVDMAKQIEEGGEA